MADLLFTAEVAVGVILGLLVTYVLTLAGRRRAIGRGSLLTLCAYAPDGSRSWRRGLLRFGAEGIEWFPMNGFSLRPKQLWARRDLELGPATPLPDGAGLDLTDAVSVACRHETAAFHLALGHAAYTALRSWVEAAPPGTSTTVH